MTEKRKKPPELEKSLAELETIVEELESGELSLDKSLQQFEKGIKLSRNCQDALKNAEQKVQMLVDKELKDFDASGLDDAD
ncbi:MAG: exodeoxyribonuclease VII small subunit [Gammaproteobacteria bacterium]